MSSHAGPKEKRLLALFDRLTFDDHARAAAATAERNRIRDRCCFDPWQRFHPTHDVFDRLLLGAAAVVSRAWQVEAHREDLRRIEANREMPEPNEGPHEQRRADQENERQRHFRDDERAAQPAVLCSTAGAARALLERLRELTARRL